MIFERVKEEGLVTTPRPNRRYATAQDNLIPRNIDPADWCSHAEENIAGLRNLRDRRRENAMRDKSEAVVSHTLMEW